MLPLGGNQEVRIDITAVEQVSPRQEITLGYVEPIMLSCVVAGVVST